MPLQQAACAPAGERMCGWGGAGGVRALRVRARSVEDVRDALERRSGPAGIIPRGLGRSYGDAAQLAGGLVLDTSELKGIELDREHGTATAQAGTTIGELLAELVPAGWVVPVVPGTQHVTVAGAIASDIHGKNHGTAGTFGSHVRAIGLLTAAGEVLELAPGDDRGLFDATIGGMGLTGVILWARFALRAVTTPLLAVDTDRAGRSMRCSSCSPHRAARTAWRGSTFSPRELVGASSPVRSTCLPPMLQTANTLRRRWPRG